ncbi:MAG: hypothetical protein JSV54_06590 [Chloroflexota bacterium]|nr:MAG: hypothetical protein JSV54_06590 [Chloroflexota bacterium]
MPKIKDKLLTNCPDGAIVMTVDVSFLCLYGLTLDKGGGVSIKSNFPVIIARSMAIYICLLVIWRIIKCGRKSGIFAGRN